MKNEFYGQDRFDSRDIVERISEIEDEYPEVEDVTARLDYLDALNELTPEQGEEADALEELIELIEFRDMVASDNFEDGMYFIEDSDFQNFAQDEAEELDLIPRDAKWPSSHIDWEEAADELKTDYTAYEWGEYTYYTRDI